MRELWLITLAPVSSGIALIAAFHPSGSGWGAWLGLAPLWWASSRRKGWPELMLGSLLGGLTFHLVLLDWMRTTYGGVGLAGPRATAWMITGAACAVSWPLAAGVYRLLRPATSGGRFVAGGAAWVTGEWLRFVGTALVDRNGFPWLQLGHSQIDLPVVAQAADLAGTWGLSGIVAGVNATSLGVLDAQRRRASLCCLAAMIGGVFAYGWGRLVRATWEVGPLVVAVSASVDPAEVSWHSLRGTSATRMDDGPGPTLLVWPEQSERVGRWRLGSAEADQRIRDFATTAQQQGIALAVGCLREEQGMVWNSLAWFKPGSGLVGFTDKQRLVAWTERDPGTGFFLPPLGGCELEVGQVSGPVLDLTTEGSSRRWLVAGGLCYDACFPQRFWALLREPAEARPDLFVVSTCEQVDVSGRLGEWAEVQARFRAIETRRSVVRVVDGGRSTLIDGNGRILKAGQAGMLILGRVPLHAQRALAPWVGPAFPWVCLLVVGAVGLTKFAQG